MKKIDTKEAGGVQENIEYLAQRFPHIVTESHDDKGRVRRKVNFDALRQELTDSVVAGPQERYHLNWPGKMQALLKSNEAVDGTLRPCRTESVNFDATQNVFIEGDNLKVLKLLKNAYLAKIKMIYIDPPYNTGRDFIYRDNFKQKSSDYHLAAAQKDAQGEQLVANLDGSGRFHSDWCSMMYSRLKVARYLLRDDGVIFISIDDNEVHNLRKICDEVFGVQNFIGTMKRRAARKTAHLSNDMSDMCDYIVIYSKADLQHPLSVGKISETTRPILNPYNILSTRKILKNTMAKCKDGVYKKGVYKVKSMSFTLLNDLEVFKGRTVNEVDIQAQFCINQEILNQTVYITKNFGLRRHVLEEELAKPKALHDLVDNPQFYNEKGFEELKELFTARDVFHHPKPVGLMKFLIQAQEGLEGPKDEIILDFFSGSASTAHAVMQLNAEDGGQRKFIMVQLPEECNKSQGLERSGATSGQVAFNNEVLIKSENRQDKAQVVASRMGGATSGARRVENYSTIADIGRERIRRAGVQIQENFIDKERHKVGSTREDGVSQVIEKTKQNIQLNKNSASGLDTGFRSFKLDTSNIVDFSQPARDVQQSGLELMGESIKPDRSAEDLLFQVLLQEGLPLHVQVHTKKILDCRVFYVLKQDDDAQDKNIKSNNTQASDVENNRAARVSSDKPDDKLKVNHVEGVELSSDDVVQPAQKQRDISLMLCLGTQTQITKSLILKLIEHRPVKIIFREAVFENDSQRVNVDQIFKQLSPSTRVEVI